MALKKGDSVSLSWLQVTHKLKMYIKKFIEESRFPGLGIFLKVSLAVCYIKEYCPFTLVITFVELQTRYFKRDVCLP